MAWIATCGSPEFDFRIATASLYFPAVRTRISSFAGEECFKNENCEIWSRLLIQWFEPLKSFQNVWNWRESPEKDVISCLGNQGHTWETEAWIEFWWVRFGISSLTDLSNSLLSKIFFPISLSVVTALKTFSLYDLMRVTLLDKTSVIRQKGESQNGCFKKINCKKQNFYYKCPESVVFVKNVTNRMGEGVGCALLWVRCGGLGGTNNFWEKQKEEGKHESKSVPVEFWMLLASSYFW